MCCKAIYHDHLESQSYFNSGRQAAQFHSALIVVVSPLNAPDQIDAKIITMPLEKRIAF